MPRCRLREVFEPDPMHPAKGTCQSLSAAGEKAFGVCLAAPVEVRADSRPCPAHAPVPEEDYLPGAGVPPGRPTDPFAAPAPPGDTAWPRRARRVSRCI